MADVPLTETTSGTLDADGEVTLTLGPENFSTWRITNLAVSGTSSATTTGGEPVPTYVVADNQDFVNNTTTLHNDLELATVLEALSVYEVEIFAVFSTTVNCDLKTATTVPAGTTGFKQNTGATQTAAAFTNRVQTQAQFVAVNFDAGQYAYQLEAGASVPMCVWERGVLTTGATAGNLQFQFAQNTATVGNLVRESSSYLKVTRIGDA